MIEDLQPGMALDLACGTGRDAVFLASLGWEVTAIDHLPDALQRGQDLARRYLRSDLAERIRWVCQDLEKVAVGGAFDLVSIFWFLDRGVLRSVPGLLHSGGSLVLETFSAIHRERYGKPRTESFVLRTGEPASLLPQLTTRLEEAGWHGDRHSVRFWATK
ncbi:MAG TPA: methyltransferase domain-containing protein [Fimbriimonadaceae bacterium]|nr:methyltransferase domain-containing protein [Fimbriimonadaceae bacterium]